MLFVPFPEAPGILTFFPESLGIRFAPAGIIPSGISGYLRSIGDRPPEYRRLSIAVYGIKDFIKLLFVVYNKVPILESGHKRRRFVYGSAVVVYMGLIYTTLFDKFHDLIKNIHGIFGFGPIPAPLVGATISDSAGTFIVGNVEVVHY